MINYNKKSYVQNLYNMKIEGLCNPKIFEAS